MKQSKVTSLIKSVASTAVGFGVAFFANMIILPWFGLDISHSANLLLTTIYTAISVARGYLLERVFEAMGWRTRMSAFASAVLAERQRQQDVEGWAIEHDDAHGQGDLSDAGAFYARWAGCKEDDLEVRADAEWGWPWEACWFKPQNFRRDLVKGCALIIAEGERFDRNRKSRRVVTDDAGRNRSASLESETGKA